MLQRAYAKGKAQHEKHHIPHSFQIGDKVWLHLKKERFTGPYRKMKPLRYGPYSILKHIGENSFHLDIPTCLGLHPVFIITTRFQIKIQRHPTKGTILSDFNLKFWILIFFLNCCYRISDLHFYCRIFDSTLSDVQLQERRISDSIVIGFSTTLSLDMWRRFVILAM